MHTSVMAAQALAAVSGSHSTSEISWPAPLLSVHPILLHQCFRVLTFLREGGEHNFFLSSSSQQAKQEKHSAASSQYSTKSYYMSLITMLSERLTKSCASQRLVLGSSFSTLEKVPSRRGSGRQSLRASLARGWSERRK